MTVRTQGVRISMSGLQTYCEHTSLHGWYYIAKDSKFWKIIWTFIVLASIIVASLFIYKAAEDFTKSTVVTTIQSTTVPLSEVYFPAVTVCNINQVSESIERKKLFWNRALFFLRSESLSLMISTSTIMSVLWICCTNNFTLAVTLIRQKRSKNS